MEKKGGCESGSAILYYAGVCRPDPGKASIGFIICLENDGTILKKFSAYLNDNFKVTSTLANYKSLIAGLQHAISLDIKQLTARGHFHNIGKQVMSVKSVQKPWEKRSCRRVQELASSFNTFKFDDIHRQDNTGAISLAREGFGHTFVDGTHSLLEEIFDNCGLSGSAKEYVMNHSLDGHHTLKFILDKIQSWFPQVHRYILSMCVEMSKEMGQRYKLKNNRVMASLLAIY